MSVFLFFFHIYIYQVVRSCKNTYIVWNYWSAFFMCFNHVSILFYFDILKFLAFHFVRSNVVSNFITFNHVFPNVQVEYIFSGHVVYRVIFLCVFLPFCFWVFPKSCYYCFFHLFNSFSGSSFSSLNSPNPVAE